MPQIGPADGQYVPNQSQGYMQAGQGYTQPQPYAAPNQQYPPQNNTSIQPLTADQLEQLIAPIALYPDNLLAIVLAASTYPAQVTQVDHWLQSMGNASPDQIAAEANAQPWDPSLKALTAFPQVLAEMDQNLQWTTVLGNVYFNQPQDVMQAVQVMRQRAQAAGNLQSTPQETVSYNQGSIALYPASQQVVYVPVYNPWSVYGQPVSPYPGFSLLGALGSFFGSSPVQYGLGMVMSAFSHTPWGLLSWGLNWLTQNLLFHQSNYYSNSTTVANWGLPRGGMFAYSGRSGMGAMGRFQSSPYRTPVNYYGRGGYNSMAAFNRTPYSYGQNHLGYGYARPAQEAYTRTQRIVSTPQQYGRSAYGYNSGFYNRPVQNYGSRMAPAYGNSIQTYRAPMMNMPRNSFTARSSGMFASNNFAGYSNKAPHSGGFHLFGGGHSSKSFHSGGGHMPKMPKSYGGGKSFSSHSNGFHGFGGHSGGGHSFGHHGR